MGSGKWDSKSYSHASTDRVRRGVSDFDYSDRVKRGEIREIHSSLDPKQLKNGQRESRDSNEHPNSIPVMIFFDVTGSMGRIPVMMAKKLEKLMDVIIEKGGIADPQVLVGAVGDATCDQYPFQVGQFESDNKFDEQLRQIILEGGGGAQMFESYCLAYYFAANHTVTDAWEKRGKKGYCFTIGDEMSWNLDAEHIQRVFGTGAQEGQKIGETIKAAMEKWEVFHLRALDGSYRNEPEVLTFWQQLLGERLVPVEDSSYICEVIAAIILSMETSMGYRHVIDKLDARGAATVENALAVIPK